MAAKARPFARRTILLEGTHRQAEKMRGLFGAEKRRTACRASGALRGIILVHICLTLGRSEAPRDAAGMRLDG